MCTLEGAWFGEDGVADNPTGEQGHYVNMNNDGYTQVACGVYVAADGEVWALQNQGG